MHPCTIGILVSLLRAVALAKAPVDGNAFAEENAEVIARRELERIQEDGRKVAGLEAQNAALEATNGKLQARIATLEQGGVGLATMDAAPSSRTAALSTQVVDLRHADASLQQDNAALVHTVQHLLARSGQKTGAQLAGYVRTLQAEVAQEGRENGASKARWGSSR